MGDFNTFTFNILIQFIWLYFLLPFFYYLNRFLGVILSVWAAFLSFKESRSIEHTDAQNIIQTNREIENIHKLIENIGSRWVTKLMVIGQRELIRGSASSLEWSYFSGTSTCPAVAKYFPWCFVRIIIKEVNDVL